MFQINLPLTGMEIWWPGLIILGLGIGFLTGMFGAGGGFLLTPGLKIFFGIPYPIAVGSGLAQIFIAGAFSAWKHWRQKNVDPMMGIIMAGGSLCGTELGVRLLKFIGTGGAVFINNRSFSILDLVMNGLFLALMSTMALVIWRESSGKGAGDEVAATMLENLQSYKLPPQVAFPRSNISSLSLWVPFLLSMLVGILTGLLGVGGGFITFPLLVYVLGVPTSVAVGTSAFQILFASGYGALRHAGQNQVEFLLVGLLLVGSLAGVQLGVFTSRFIGGRKIRHYFALVIRAGILVIVIDLLKNMF